MRMFQPDQDETAWEQRLLTRTGRFVLALVLFFFLAAMMIVTQAVFNAIAPYVGPTLAPLLKG